MWWTNVLGILHPFWPAVRNHYILPCVLFNMNSDRISVTDSPVILRFHICHHDMSFQRSVRLGCRPGSLARLIFRFEHWGFQDVFCFTFLSSTTSCCWARRWTAQCSTTAMATFFNCKKWKCCCVQDIFVEHYFQVNDLLTRVFFNHWRLLTMTQFDRSFVCFWSHRTWMIIYCLIQWLVNVYSQFMDYWLAVQ